MNGEMEKLGFWGAILRPKNYFFPDFFLLENCYFLPTNNPSVYLNFVMEIFIPRQGVLSNH